MVGVWDSIFSHGKGGNEKEPKILLAKSVDKYDP